MKFVLQATFARRGQKVQCRLCICVLLDTTALSNLDPRSRARQVSIRISQDSPLVLHARPDTTAREMPLWFRSCACQGFTAQLAHRARMRIHALRAGTVHPPAFVRSLIALYALQAFTVAARDPRILLACAKRASFVRVGRRLPRRSTVLRAIFVLVATFVPRDPARPLAALQAPFPMPRG